MADSTPSFFSREVDVTPKISFSTVQFQSEILNTIVNAILVSFIVVNLGSIVKKVVNVTKRDYFCYNDYLRAIIFSSSDDIARLLSWLNGENSYISADWLTHNTRLRRRRLIFPLLARLFILSVTFASVALSIPSERLFVVCDDKDYRPTLRNTGAPSDNPQVLPSFCTDVPLSTNRGTVNTRLSYCSSKIATGSQLPAEVGPGSGAVQVTYDPKKATIRTTFFSRGSSITREIYLEWSRTKGSTQQRRERFRAIFSDFTDDVLFALAERAIDNDKRGCRLVANTNTQSRSRRFSGCEFEPEKIDEFFDAFVRSALFFVPTEETQMRVVFPPDGAPNNKVVCPIEVTVNRPMLNMLPMGLLLLLSFQLNLAVSFTVSQHGNVDDATYHLVKEAVNADVTSNPVQITEADREFGGKLRFRQVHCANGNATAGFLTTPDDAEVDLSAEPRRVVSRRSDRANLDSGTATTRAPAY